MLGFDDGPFTFEQATTPIAGVMTRGGGYVEAVLTDKVTVDGRDATETILELLDGRPMLETVHAIAFDGGALGGFNVLDLDAIHDALGLPVIAVIRDPPDDAAVRAALLEHFDDAAERYRLLTNQPIEPIELGTGCVHVRRAGGELDTIEELLRIQTVRGRTPEPLRIAHLVATALVEGRSRGA